MITPFDETLAAAGLFLTAEERCPTVSSWTYAGAWGRVFVGYGTVMGWTWEAVPKIGGWARSAVSETRIPLDSAHRALCRALKF